MSMQSAGLAKKNLPSATALLTAMIKGAFSATVYYSHPRSEGPMTLCIFTSAIDMHFVLENLPVSDLSYGLHLLSPYPRLGASLTRGFHILSTRRTHLPLHICKVCNAPFETMHEVLTRLMGPVSPTRYCCTVANSELAPFHTS